MTNLLRISKTFLSSIGTPSFLESNHPLRNERFKKKISFKDVYTYIWIKEQLVPPLNLPSFPGTISRGSCKKPVIYSPPGRRGGGWGVWQWSVEEEEKEETIWFIKSGDTTLGAHAGGWLIPACMHNLWEDPVERRGQMASCRDIVTTKREDTEEKCSTYENPFLWMKRVSNLRFASFLLRPSDTVFL